MGRLESVRTVNSAKTCFKKSIKADAYICTLTKKI